MNKGTTTIKLTVLAVTLAAGTVVTLAGQAMAQVWDPNPSFDADSGMYLPNVNGPAMPPYTPAPEGQPPPIGDGYMPMGTNPGHLGYPVMPPPSAVSMPLIPPGPDGKAMATSYVGGYLTPPSRFENETYDPGIIDSPPDFYEPPVAVKNINPGGGITGDAPIDRWGGQTTQDFGRSSAWRAGGSQTSDFGEKLSQKPNLQKQPQFSEDGPRNQVSPGQRGQANRSQNLPGSQSTTDLNGNRSLFSNQRARLTIAPY